MSNSTGNENSFGDAVYEAAMEANNIESLTEILYYKLRNLLNIDRLAFASLENGLIRAEYAYGDSKTQCLKPPFAQHFLKSSLRIVAQSGKPRIINDLAAYFKFHPSSASTELLLREKMLSGLVFPMLHSKKCEGFLFINSRKAYAFNDEIYGNFEKHGKLLSIAYSKISAASKVTLDAIIGFSEIAEKRDNETGLHMKRVAHYARAIGEELLLNNTFPNFTYKELKQIFLQTPLHDLGKVGIPDNILLKPEKLSEEEFAVIKNHPLIGYSILDKINEPYKAGSKCFFKAGGEILRHHHERWDGKGYPDGLNGEAIPLSARIVAVADVFDALTSVRPYKPAFSIEESIRIIKNSSGSHFDPKIVDAFINIEPKIREIHRNYRDITSFTEIKDAHSIWADTIIKAINGGKNQHEEIEILHHKCRTGVFLDNIGKNDIPQAEFQELHNRHRILHRYAGKLFIEMYKNIAELEKDLEIFKLLSKKFLSLVDKIDDQKKLRN